MAALTIRSHRAAAGLQWLRDGLRLFVRQPLMLFLLVAVVPVVVLVGLVQVPVLGQAACLMLYPTMMIGMLCACRQVEAGRVPGLRSYAEALSEPGVRWQLFRIGVYYALIAGALATLWSLLPDEPPPAAGTNAADKPELTMTPLGALAVLGSVVIWVPLQMTMWFAPPLCAWHGMAAGKALFFSFFACWRNRMALLVYVLAIGGASFLVMLLLAGVASAVGAGDRISQVLIAPLPLLAMAVSQASNLVIYRAVVEVGAAAPHIDAPPAAD
jgi:hypothetical protein